MFTKLFIFQYKEHVVENNIILYNKNHALFLLLLNIY